MNRTEDEIREEKRRLRQWAREQRNGMSPESRAEASRRIEERVLALPAYLEARTVMAYMSLPGEPETRGIIRDAANRGKRVLLPRCTDRERMEAALFTGFEHLVPGKMNIPEPAGNDPEPVPAPDLILVPCVAATRDGKRLGHGAGYYDRFLKTSPGLRVCLCFEALLAEALPTDENDIRMDLVLTDREENPTEEHRLYETGIDFNAIK